LLKQRASHFSFPEGIYVSVQSSFLTDKGHKKMENFPLENDYNLFFFFAVSLPPACDFARVRFAALRPCKNPLPVGFFGHQKKSTRW
jgi:hypothetical protein